MSNTAELRKTFLMKELTFVEPGRMVEVWQRLAYGRGRLSMAINLTKSSGVSDLVGVPYTINEG